MVSNCSIYLPTSKVDFKALLPGGTSNGGLFRKTTRYEYETEQGRIVLNIRFAKDDQKHLSGFKGYVAQLDNTEAQKTAAYALINRVQMVIGVELPHAVDSNSSAFDSLMHLVSEMDGFMFVADSILRPDGFVAGPMTYPEAVTEPVATVSIPDEEMDGLRAETPPHLQVIRDQSIAMLSERGFSCAEWLPFETSHQLRPTDEIARRFCALVSVFLYASDGGQGIADTDLTNFNHRNQLSSFFASNELKILNLDRNAANQAHRDTIGWRLENMWAMAWVLGFDPEPPFYAGQLSDEVIQGISNFFPGVEADVEDFVTTLTPRSEIEVVRLEDLFYCAHNAVRSAQLGRPTVPDDFDSVADGGAIHERRHSLTWCLSPACAWDDTDLST